MTATDTTTEQLAVIKNFNIGVGDRGRPAIWFDTYINEHEAALQVIEGAQAIYDLIDEAGLTDVTKIEGRVCWVATGNHLIRYLRMMKP